MSDVTAEPALAAPTGRRIVNQGLLLSLGASSGQLMSFARNALLGHLLSKGDFGVAASLAITLQLLEMISDVAVDRMIVRAPDGDNPEMQATGQSLLLARGVIVAALLFALAPSFAAWFSSPEAAPAFALLALVPLIRGAMHLDVRRAQRRLDNRPLVAMETLPQALSLALCAPVVMATGDASAVVWLVLVQAATAISISHIMADRTYRLTWNGKIARDYLIFGWPIILSAIPLIAVFQGDRLVVAQSFNIAELGAYSAAFMLTMIPSVLMAKVGLSLLLPVFAEAEGDATRCRTIFADWMAIAGLITLSYFAAFWIAGGSVLRIAFGPNFAGYGFVVQALAAMWAIRMLQVVPGALLMARGKTSVTLYAGIARAAAIALAIVVALEGGSLAAIAATGIAGELASTVVVWCWLRESNSNRADYNVAQTIPLPLANTFARDTTAMVAAMVALVVLLIFIPVPTSMGPQLALAAIAASLPLMWLVPKLKRLHAALG